MLSVTDSASDPPDLTQSEPRSMEDESQASGLEQSESEKISMLVIIRIIRAVSWVNNHKMLIWGNT